MSRALHARFKPSPADYFKATMVLFFSQRLIIFLAVISVLFIGAAIPISLIYRAQGSDIALYLLAIAVGYFLIAAATVAAPLLHVHRLASQDERMRAETSWSVEEERITVRNRYEKVELSWQMFERLIDSREYFVLVYAENKRQFSFLPKRAFLDKEDCRKFAELSREKIR